MTAFTLELQTLCSNAPIPGTFYFILAPDHTETLGHAVARSGTFTTKTADGYALLHYPPSWHLGEFRSNRLIRFLRLNRTNLRLAFGRERGDDHWQELVRFRRSMR